MTTLTTVVVILLVLYGVVLFVQLGALVELFEQVKQVRAYLQMEDRPTTLELGRSQGLAASAVGLPAALDDADQALVLFLSNRCETCRTIAATLAGGAPPAALWVVVEPTSGDGSEFVEEFQLRGDRVLVDRGERIATQLGLDVTPAAILVEQGRLAHAQTVPTVRQLYATLPVAYKRTLTPKLLVVSADGRGTPDPPGMK
jgi:hypothetical protein